MKKGSRILIAILGVLAIITLGSTTAYFTQNGNEDNGITMGTVEIEVHEDIELGMKKNITATLLPNTVDCWVRMYVAIPRGNGKDLFKTPTPLNGWIKGEDNYYYYPNTVNNPSKDKEKVLPILFSEVVPEEGLTLADLPENNDIIIYAEAIQQKPGDTDCVTAFKNFKK